GLCDWCVEKVKIRKKITTGDTGDTGRRENEGAEVLLPPVSPVSPVVQSSSGERCLVEVWLHQKGECTEQTVLGIALDKDEEYGLRIAILPGVPRLELPEVGSVVESLPDQRVRVEVELPCKPKQIAVDPDQILVDKDPSNNFWKRPVKVRVTPVYT